MVIGWRAYSINAILSAKGSSEVTGQSMHVVTALYVIVNPDHG